MKKTVTILVSLLLATSGYSQRVWDLNGNSNADSTNFLGTTNNVPLVIKVNNQHAGYSGKDTGPYPTDNVTWGYMSMDPSKGTYNTAIGNNTLNANTTGFRNTAIGALSLRYNTTGSRNTATGFGALRLNSTGSVNTANGSLSLYHNTTGIGNTAIGQEALTLNNTGDYNTATGHQSMANNTTGSRNTAFGTGALVWNNTGSENTAIGSQAMWFNKTGQYNVAAGSKSFFNNTTGKENVAIGHNALNANITGSYNTILGATADVSSENLNNATAIGYKAIATASNQVRIGNDQVTSIRGTVNWTTLSDRSMVTNVQQNVPGVEFINQLQPVTYTISGRNSQSGFIAQDVNTAAQSIGYNFSGVDATGGESGLRYAELVVPLVKAVQELSEENKELKNQLNELKEALISQGIIQREEANFKSNTNSSKTINIASASIEQNAPNPFDQFTTIRYTLPETFSSAKIVITDNTGRSMKQVPVTTSGTGEINIEAGSLNPGVYYYSLYIDNQLIDTKKMVVK